MEPVMNDQAVGMFAGLVGVGFFLLIGAFVLALLAFWVWMLVDCIQRNFPPNEQNAKIVWILVIVLAGWLGALIYFFVVKKGKVKGP
jgi:phospholipase D-like protein